MNDSTEGPAKDCKSITAGFFIAFNQSMTGGPRVVANITEGLMDQSLRSVVMTNKESELTEVLAANKVPFTVEIPSAEIDERDGETLTGGMFLKFRAALGLILYNFRIWKVLGGEKVNILWVRNIKGVLLVGLSAWARRIPLIWDIGMEKPSQGLMRVLHRVGFLLAKRVVAEGQSVFQSVFNPSDLESYGAKLMVIPSGIPEQRVKALEDGCGLVWDGKGAFRIVCVAALSDRKNQSLLIEAVANLISDGLDVRLDFVGSSYDSTYEQTCRKLVSSLGFTDEITFHGFQEDIPAYLHSSHLFALPSTNEGVPYSILEAMHARLPVIAMPVGGVPDVVKHMQSGYLAKSTSVDGFAKDLRWCFDHTEALAKMVEGGSMVISGDYNVKLWRDRYRTLMVELANHKIKH